MLIETDLLPGNYNDSLNHYFNVLMYEVFLIAALSTTCFPTNEAFFFIIYGCSRLRS